jgi:hypothetical protein
LSSSAVVRGIVAAARAVFECAARVVGRSSSANACDHEETERPERDYPHAICSAHGSSRRPRASSGA